jgi:hypothetical protein
VCNEEDCQEKRAAFAREPWLPGGFEIGAQWYSYDNGITWNRCPPGDRFGGVSQTTMTVTAIDRKTGTATVKVG